MDELLASFNVSKNGFLPGEEPLKNISSPYYEPWELMIHNLQSLLGNGTLRQRVDCMPVLLTSKLRTEPEWRRAYVILTLLTHSYVWGGSKASEVNTSKHPHTLFSIVCADSCGELGTAPLDIYSTACSLVTSRGAPCGHLRRPQSLELHLYHCGLCRTRQPVLATYLHGDQR